MQCTGQGLVDGQSVTHNQLWGFGSLSIDSAHHKEKRASLLKGSGTLGVPIAENDAFALVGQILQGHHGHLGSCVLALPDR